jgi:hypothetical protein
VTETNHQNSFLLSRWIYLRSLGLIHFVAYLSLSVQILMLNGENGILPIAGMLERLNDVYGADAYGIVPTIFWFNSSDPFILGVCIFGIVLSILVTLGILTGPSLILLAALYSSLDNASGEFMAFQSDGLIIEATVLALFVVPWSILETPWSRSSKSLEEPSNLALALNRFLLFRLMFGAGLVKLLSHDPTWVNLTALSYHQETQPIPSPLAWFVHHAPMWVHKGSAIFTFAAELIAPFFYFSPRRLRFAAAFISAVLHVGIALTGNYTFLNYLSIALCIPLIDDAWFEKLVPFSLAKRLRNYLFIPAEKTLPVSLDDDVQAPEATSEDGRIGKTSSVETHSNSALKRASRLAIKLSVIIFFVLSGCQFIIGVIGSYILPTGLGRVLTVLSPYRIFNSYGMFAVMTTTRPEIVFEGSADGKVWLPYTFKYKVDDLQKAPAVVAPHMPRLDWRLWFASMRDATENPWVMNLARLMLKGDPAVLSAFRSNPFPDRNPRYIRAFVYDYHFTDWRDLSEKGEWWRRDKKSIFFPPVELNEQDEIVPAAVEIRQD